MRIGDRRRRFDREARPASRENDEESAEATRRRDAVARWERAREQGATGEEAARAMGISRATLYRWTARPEPRSRRPLRMRQPHRPPALVEAVRATRADRPTWGRAKIAALLRREGWAVSESTVGRILKALADPDAAIPIRRPDEET